MKLRTAFVSSFLGLASLVALLGIINVIVEKNNNKYLGQISQTTIPKLLTLEQIKSASSRMMAETLSQALVKSELTRLPANVNQLENINKEYADENREFEIALNEFESYTEKLKLLNKNLQSEKFFQELQKYQGAIQEKHQQIISLKNTQAAASLVLTAREDLENLEEELIEFIDQAINKEVEELKNAEEIAYRNDKNALKFNLVSIVLLAIIAIFLGLYLAKKVVQPIIEIKDAAVKIGQGKLNVRVQSKNLTEIAILSDTFNKMADNLAKITVSQSYFDNVLRSMIDALIVLNRDLSIKTFNFAAFLLLKYEEESELIGKSLKNILGDERFLIDLEDSGLTQNNSFLGRKETTFLSKLGEKIPVYVSFSILRDDEGQIQGFVCLAQDITERKRAEAARQESEAKWRSLVENAPDTIITADATGTIQFINRVMPGLTTEQVIGTSVYDCVPPESRQQLRQIINSVFETGQSQNCEISWLGANGEPCWYSSRLGPVHNSGQVVAVTLISSDITERKRMEEALRESEDRLEGILNSLTDIVWSVCAQTFETLYLNPAAETIYSRPVSDFFHNSNLWLEVIYPDDRERAIFASQEMFTTGLKEIEYRIVRPDGEVRWLHDRGHLTCAADGTPLRFDGIATDITERKRAEEALQKLNEDLEIRVQERTKAFKQANKRLQQEIGERQLVAEALRHSEERLNGILNSLDDVVWSIDATTFQLLYLSSAVEKVYGRSVSDFLGNPNIWLEVIHPEDSPNVQNMIQQRFALGAVELEYRIVHPTGEVRWLHERSRVVYNAEGEAIRLDGISSDITEAKQAQEALLTSEKHYRAIVEDQTELICRLLPDATLTFVNDAYCRYFKKQREELINHRFMSMFPEKEQAIAIKNLKSVSVKKPVITWEHQLIFSNGEIRVQQWTNRAIFDEFGHVIEFQAVGRDITQRKRAEAALRKSEAQYRNLAKREALLNQLASQIRNSLDLDTILDAAVREIRSLLQIDRCLFMWYRSNGVGSQPNDFSSPASNFKGQTTAWEVVKEARNPALPSLLGYYPDHPEAQYMTKLMNREIIRVDDLTLSSDSEYQKLHSNWGYISIVILPIVTLAGEIGLLCCGHCSAPRHWRDSELTLLQAISDQLAIAISQAELYAHATDAARAAKEQAQQLQQAMKALQQTQAQLIQTEKMSSLGQMVAGVAHEINNPVSFIYGNVDPAMEYIEDLLNLLELYRQSYPEPLPIIQDEIEAIDLEFLKEDLPKLLSSMKVGAERIRQIVLSLRNFSRLDEAQMKSVDIHEGLDNTLLILQNRLKGKGQISEIQVIKDYGNLPPVQCFAGQLNQVFMNILANAIDALEENRKLGNPSPNPVIQIHTSNLDEQLVEIRMSDNGPGMSEEVRQRVFDPFFTTKPVGAGTGLGLSISYQIVVEKHGGELRCVSTIGQGTEFIMRLPVQQNYAEPALFK